MDAERFRRARALFEATVELDAAARREYLDRVCGDDGELRRNVEALLERDAEESATVRRVLRDAVLDFHGVSRDATRPERIASYAILDEIGQGGMSVVYLAWDGRLERRIAVKVLPPELARDAAALARFQQEARLLAALNHPGIATIYSLEEDGGVHFLTMELIEGESLKSRLARDTPGLEDTLSFVRQIATALEVAHGQGVVHRDLKPANVMITPDGLVKVLDFGLATSLTLGGEATTGPVAGTPGYMSPEQLRGEDVNYAADVWSFGCVLYECLAGAPAFPGGTASDRMAATLKGDVDWTRLPADTDSELWELLRSCLAREPSDRVRTMRVVRRTLEELIMRRARARPPSFRRQRGNLPVPVSSFVGREDAIARLSQLLEVNRLVTLTGTGGAGKTRLAVEVARRSELSGGAWIVELAQVGEGDLVPGAVAVLFGIKEDGGQTLTQGLIDALAREELLLVLDNCEHLLPACAELSRAVLHACPGVRILATSREKLGVRGEINYHVPSLELPPSTSVELEELSAIETVRLFVERASAESCGFRLTSEAAPVVADICRRLDGIPLALELAAARVRVLPLAEIARRLDDRFRLLTGGSRSAVQQHQTLRALIDWSHGLLTDAEKELLRRLAIFAGGWTLQAAEEVCAVGRIEQWRVLDLHASLVDKSLVEMDAQASETTGQTRYRMLETIRLYARERLAEAGEEDRLRGRHRDFFLSLAEEALPELTRSGQALWYHRLAAEHENLRLALRACTREADPELGFRLAGALGQYWDTRGRFTEGRAALEEVFKRPGASRATAARALALEWGGYLAYRQADYARANELLSECKRIRSGLGDDDGVAKAIAGLADVAETQGRDAEARKLFEESLAILRRLERRSRAAEVLARLGKLDVRQTRYTEARPLLKESLAIRREEANDVGTLSSLNYLGELALFEGEHAQAREYAEEAVEIADRLGERHGLAAALHTLGRVADATGAYERSRSLLERSLKIRWSLRDRYCTSRSLVALAMLAARGGKLERSARLFGATEAVLNEIDSSLSPADESARRPWVEKLRSGLPAETLDREWARGRVMPREDIIDYALQSGPSR